MIIYDHWSYMTMFGILEVVFIALRERIQIDRLLFEESREEQSDQLQDPTELPGFLHHPSYVMCS